MIIEKQKNIKVHFAAVENTIQAACVFATGAVYCLYTAYPFIERMLFDKPKFPIIKSFLENETDIPKYCISNSRHCIQDSGLFTLMFGSGKHAKKDKKFLDNYCDALIDFTNCYSHSSTIVEMDTQKVLGVDSAWEYRYRMAQRCKNRIINVFHLEDGQKGLDRLIEYSDYIAISVPELRFAGKKQSVPYLANYIKEKKSTIDIHLLGCTEMKLLEQLKFCTSSDSTTYTSGVRYGQIAKKHISAIKPDAGKKIVGVEKWEKITKFISPIRANGLIVHIYYELLKYNKLGCQK